MEIVSAFENIKSAWMAERPQWALWLPVGLGTGIAVYFALPYEPSRYLGMGLAALCFFILFRAKADGLRMSAAGLLSVALGFTAAGWRTAQVAAPVLEDRIGPIGLTGTVEKIDVSATGARIVLSGPVSESGRLRAPPENVRLSVKGNTERIRMLLPGDRIRATAILRPPPPPTMPGAFDFQRRAYYLRLGAYGFVLGDIETLGNHARAPPIPVRVRRDIETVRLRISARVHELQKGDAGAVAAALLTGHRGYIDDRVLQVMRDAGIAHLLAISGLHIGLVAGFIYAAVRLGYAAVPIIGLRLNGKKLAAASALPTALGYAVLAGFTVPTERAFLMTGLMLAGVMLDRRALSMRSVAWAAAVILLCRPESLVGPGFQMSFAAVTALIAAYSAMSDWHRRQGNTSTPGLAGRFGRYLLSVIVTTVIASAATAPFAIYHFQHAAAFGLVANAVAVPLAALWVMPAGIVTLAAMPFGLDAIPLTVMCSGIEVILSSAGYLAQLPGAAFDFAAPPVWCLGLTCIAGLWLALWRGRWRLLGVPGLIFSLAGPVFATAPDIIIDGDARLIAVLHHDAAYLTSNGRRARFEAEDWRQRMGQSSETSVWRADAEASQGRLRCDAQGCTVIVGRGLVAISTDAATLADDCRKSRMIVATVPVRRDCSPPWGIIDRFDLWRYGTHAITFTDAGPVVRTVNGERGRRPWVNWPDD